MSKSPRDENPNATIQLSALDAEQLVQFDPPPEAPRAARTRTAPPPLPPVGLVPSHAPAGISRGAPTVGSKGFGSYLGLFVLLLAAAVGAGLAIGMYARSRRAPVPEQSGAAATAAASPVSGNATSGPAVTAPSSSAPKALVMPTVEVTSPAQ
jgi:hypothetical protein